jgi:tetratricopeptide (TPR) repeat protein
MENGMAMRFERLAIFTLSILISSSCIAGQVTPKAPATGSTQRQAALALEQQGRSQEAEQAWRAIAKADPRNAEAYAHIGLLLARRENYAEAIPLYRKALSLNPAIPSLRMNLGLALFKGGFPKQSIGEFTQLLNAPKVSPSEAYRLRVLIGMAHYGQGEYGDAVPFLKDAAGADPKNLEIRLVLAHSCMWTKQDQCVLDTYKEILAIDPESAEACVLAGEALDAMKNPLAAIEQFRHAIRANPQQPNVHFDLGYLLWTQKAYDEAGKEFQTELKLDPDHTQSLLYLADIDVKAGRSAEALPLLERVEKADPASPLAHLDLGIALTDAERTDDALKELQEAARLDPDNADVHWRLGRIYRSRGQTDAANAELAKTSALNKAKYDDLQKQIANGHPRPAPDQAPTPAAPDKWAHPHIW